MAYAAPFLRMVVSGKLFATEDYSWSLSLIDPTGTAPTPTAVPAALVTALVNYHTALDMKISQRAVMYQVKLNEIGTDGRYANPTTVWFDWVSGILGPATANVPAQQALTISLRTPIARGRAHAGRYYLPMVTAVPGNTGQITASDQTNIMNASKTFLDAVNAALDPWQIGVVSDVGSGTYQPVTKVRVGSVLDTIRSRREKIPEAYKDVDLAG